MRKFLCVLSALAILSLGGWGSALAQEEASAIGYEATANVDIQLDRDYEFDFMGETDIKAEVEAQEYTVGVDVGIGNLTLSPRVGVWNGEAEVADATIESSAGLLVGIGAEWLLAEPIDDLSISMIGDYEFGDSAIDKFIIDGETVDNLFLSDINRHDIEGGLKVAYADLPLDGVLSLGMVYSLSEINVEIADFDLDLESKGFGLRPALTFEPLEDLTIEVGGKFIDQTAVSGKVCYKF